MHDENSLPLKSDTSTISTNEKKSSDQKFNLTLGLIKLWWILLIAIDICIIFFLGVVVLTEWNPFPLINNFREKHYWWLSLIYAMAPSVCLLVSILNSQWFHKIFGTRLFLNKISSKTVRVVTVVLNIIIVVVFAMMLISSMNTVAEIDPTISVKSPLDKLENPDNTNEENDSDANEVFNDGKLSSIHDDNNQLDYDIGDEVKKSVDLMHFFENTKMLDKDQITYDQVSITKLNTQEVYIKEYNMSYGSLVSNMNRKYTNLQSMYWERKEIDVSVAIKEYDYMIERLEAAKKQSIIKADGVDYALLSLIARDYKELAFLKIQRGNSDDKESIESDSAKAISAYAALYRMIVKNGREEELLPEYNPTYWIGAVYHTLGDYENNEIFIQLGEFVTAKSFFNKQSEVESYNKFSDYAKYYTAISSHKAYLLAKSDGYTPADMLEQLLTYAYDNYNAIKDSSNLNWSETKMATDAIKLLSRERQKLK